MSTNPLEYLITRIDHTLQNYRYNLTEWEREFLADIKRMLSDSYYEPSDKQILKAQQIVMKIERDSKKPWFIKH